MEERYTLNQAFRISLFIASSMVLSGVVLAFLVSPLFVALCILVAFGLLVTALTGFCPMAWIIQKLFVK
ncbi:MAG: DUF2892 domain-containing protein [Candidatus Dojkabacteria bacterium]